MPCDPSIFDEVELFGLLDKDEKAVLAENVELRQFPARHKIFKAQDAGGKAFIVVSGKVKLTVIDEDNQEVVVDTPTHGEIFGLSSMLSESPHQTTAQAVESTVVIEIDRNDLSVLIQRKPQAGLDMLTMMGRQFRASQDLIRTRAARNANDMIEESETFGDYVADGVARFGGSWRFIISFGVVLVVYTTINIVLGRSAWDPYPFILLNLFLSMLAAIQAPVIMMSQNRQDIKDRLRSELDFAINRKAELEITTLTAKLRQMEEQLDRIEERVM